MSWLSQGGLSVNGLVALVKKSVVRKICGTLLLSIIACILVLATVQRAAAASFDEWVRRETSVSEQKMLANISPRGAARGAVIASPSRTEPNYYFHWIRDAGLVMDTVREFYERSSGAERARYFAMMEEFARFSRQNQLTPTSTGLGDPRFNVDGSADYEPWGRPQNDGPAIRALTLIRFAESLLKDGRKDYVKAELYQAKYPADSVIKADLEYVAHHWREKSFDPWEEIRGQHFFTRAFQWAALSEGANLAEKMGDSGAARFYREQAAGLVQTLGDHWDEGRGYYLATVESEAGPDHQKPSELDSSVIIAALTIGEAKGPTGLVDDRILATATALEQTFASIYPINRDTSVGTAIGRYREDYYFGGNPWPLATAAFAELHYRVARILKTQTSYVITPRSLAFFSAALPASERAELKAGIDLAQDSALKAKLVAGLEEKGDGFLRRIQRHANPDGSLSEQINKVNGYMISAPDLTWSYSAFLKASFYR